MDKAALRRALIEQRLNLPDRLERAALLQQVAGYHRGVEAAMQQQPGAAAAAAGNAAGPAVRAARVR